MTEPTYWLADPSKEKRVNVRRLRKERADRGWSEYDFWNFHGYHSWMMISVLERFKTGMGYPVDDRVKSMEDWIEVLDEMIEGFKASLDLIDMVSYDRKIHKSYKEWEEPLRAKYERGMDLFRIYYLTLWD